MRILFISLIVCLLNTGSLFAQTKSNSKTNISSKSTSLSIKFQKVKTPEVANTSDSLKIRKNVLEDIGYGFIKKDAVSGAVSSVNISDLEKSSYSNLAQYLMGRVAGVSVTKNPSSPGGYSILIRGITSLNFQRPPLFIIDGVPVSQEDALESVNPNDIASVDIIKDGTAAIYGVRGANGVILITTKN